MTFDFDLFVIGGGSGGVRAARIAAAEHGAKVALAEEFRMGGTCVIRGCVPKKLMVFASNFAQSVEDGREYGWDIRQNGFDWSRFRPRLDTELDRLEAAYRRTLHNANVTVFDSRAVLDDAHTVRLADGSVKTAKHILIATGGHPFVFDFPGSELAITSNDIFLLDELPKSILIVGGGYIACEFACILNGLGVQVTQYYRGDQILRGFDDEVRGHISDLISKQGVDLRLNADVAEMQRNEHGVSVTATDGGVHQFDAAMFATGRIPNTLGLGLEDIGVKIGKRGEIQVDEWSQTSVPSIFAVGDVTDRINLTPVAIREGHAFADTVFGGRPTRADHDQVPGAVFTQPEYGYVGMSEEEAQKEHRIEVYATAFRPMRGAFIGRDEKVLFKLIVDADTDRVLGVHIVADGAGELIQLAAIAVKMGATKKDFDRTVAVHPTIAEELVTMRTPVRTA